MFFTQEDYRKIEKWLLANSRKDTDFAGAATPLKGNETVVLVQNGKNVKASVKDVVEQLFLLGVSDFVNITDKYGESYISLSQAIELIPYRSRKIGQVVTFLDDTGKWAMYQFQGLRKNQWNTLSLWVDLIDLMKGMTVVDSEDIVTEVNSANQVALKFADKTYNEADYSGLGRVYLRKNVVNVEDPVTGNIVKMNYLTQSMISKENTIYIIQYDYNLNKQTITTPRGCVLLFEGGSIENGTINYNGTLLEGNIDLRCSVIGTLVNGEINPEWFGLKYGDKNSGDINRNAIQSALNIAATSNKLVKINSGIVWIKAIDGSSAVWNSKLIPTIEMPSNTSMVLESDTELKVIPNNYIRYALISFQECENSAIIGGILTGDVLEHTYVSGSSSEWCHGIQVLASSNITIRDLTVQDFPGDGLGAGALYITIPVPISNHSQNVEVINVRSLNNRRQAFSITGAIGVKAINCDLSGTGSKMATSPSAGIDIESDGGEGVMLKDIYVSHCRVVDNGLSYAGSLRRNVAMWNPLSVLPEQVDNIVFSDCDFRNTDSTKEGFVSAYYKVEYNSCKFDVLSTGINYPDSQLVTLNYCTLRSLIINEATNATLNFCTILSSPNYRQIQTYTDNNNEKPTGKVILNNCVIELSSPDIIGNGIAQGCTTNIRFNVCTFRNVGSTENQGVRLFSATYYECIYENCVMGVWGETGNPIVVAGYNLKGKFNGRVVTNEGLYMFNAGKPWISNGTEFKAIEEYIPTVTSSKDGLFPSNKLTQLPSTNVYSTKEWSYNVGTSSMFFIVWIYTDKQTSAVLIRSTVNNGVVSSINVINLLNASNLEFSIKVNLTTGVVAFKRLTDMYTATLEQSILPTTTPISRLNYPANLEGFEDTTVLTGLWDGEVYRNSVGTLVDKVVII